MYTRYTTLLLASLFVLACGEGTKSGSAAEISADALVNQPLAELPPLLSQTGLFALLPDSTPSNAMPYEPTWPLWSSGSQKARMLVLPKDTKIDNSDPENWVFPVGTLIFKTFSFPVGDGNWKPVETRLMRKGEEEWEYHVYKWNAEGIDAELISIKKSTPTPAIGPDGEGFDHVIPGRLDCRKCHESNLTRVIGISELQLSSPTSSEGAVIATLYDRGLLMVSPSSPLPLIEHEDPITEKVLGYMEGNCNHCHNGGDGPATSFDLRHDVMLANTIGVPTEGSGSAVGIRVVPGYPEESIFFVGFSGETNDPEIKMMPPVGAEKIDLEAVELFRTWIESLDDTRPVQDG